jgi:hypothetical protein
MRQPPNFGTGDRLIMSQPGRSQELIQKYFDELASEDELLELEQLLASEPDAAALFAETARLHAGLHDLFRKQYKIDQVAALLDSSDALALPVPPTKPSPGHEDSADSRPAGSTSDSAFIPIPKHLVGRRRERFRFVVPAIPWKWIGTAALLLAVTLGGWLWFRPSAAGPQLVAGTISVAGQKLSKIPENTPFEVSGNPAVLRFPDGSRVELAVSTRAQIRRSRRGYIVEIAQGGGDFQISGDAPTLSVETGLGRVTTSGGRFTLDFVTTMPPQFSLTEPLRLPQLVVAVVLGTAHVEHAGAVMTLGAGEQHIFFSPT